MKREDHSRREEEARGAEAEVEKLKGKGVLVCMRRVMGPAGEAGMKRGGRGRHVRRRRPCCEALCGDRRHRLGPLKLRRGERHRALVRVEAVNGQSPEEKRTHFEDLTAAPPHRRLLPPDAAADPLVRAVDLLGPLAFGQRVLVLAEPRSGRTTLLRALGLGDR